MNEFREKDGRVHMDRPNSLQRYVIDCINSAVKRLEEHILVKNDPLKYVIRTILGLDQPHDPEWQPNCRFAKDNLADTETAMKFITDHYHPFKETVETMIDNFGSEYYEHVFSKGFDLVRLTSFVYNEVVDQIAGDLNLRDD